MKQKIGLIGKGFVGEAFYEGMKNDYTVLVWDKDPSKRTVNSLEELVSGCTSSEWHLGCAITFVSVPTPMKLDGGCDTSILESVLEEMDSLYLKVPFRPHIVVIRSTIPPGTTDRLQAKTQNLSLVFNPEFLTEANHIHDFRNQDRIILGGPEISTAYVMGIYRRVFPKIHFVRPDAKTAEMVKYTNNTFLATKVTFANEIKQICEISNIDYEDMISIAALDKRLGNSHWKVPGPDGKRGFGGTCFPKDINALLAYAKELGVETPFLQAVWDKNLNLRPEKDWEQLKGRAVSE
jgi:nucleotide sugar dehydrogenase